MQKENIQKKQQTDKAVCKISLTGSNSIFYFFVKPFDPDYIPNLEKKMITILY